MNYLTYFKQWLHIKKYNPNTIRNYLADIRKYIHFISHSSPARNAYSIAVAGGLEIRNLQIFSQSNLQSYLLFIKDKKNSRRYLTSLSKYFQFALSENLIEENPFKNTRKQLLKHRNTHFDKFLQMYQIRLIRLRKTPVTIKNYINDIQQYLDYLQNITNLINAPLSRGDVRRTEGFDQIFESQSIKDYIVYLKNTHRSLSSIKRKLSSLTSFQNFLIRRKFLIKTSPFHQGEMSQSDRGVLLPPEPLYPQKNKFHITRFLSRFYRNDITKVAK